MPLSRISANVIFWGGLTQTSAAVRRLHQVLSSRKICCSRSRYFITSSTVSVSEISWRVNPAASNA